MSRSRTEYVMMFSLSDVFLIIRGILFLYFDFSFRERTLKNINIKDCIIYTFKLVEKGLLRPSLNCSNNYENKKPGKKNLENIIIYFVLIK